VRGTTDYHTGSDGVYIISVAARIVEMHPQTLRKYERIGLVSPFRTGGMLRLYSEEDLARLRLIKHLVGDLGLNLSGVELVLEIFNRLLKLRIEAEVAGTRGRVELKRVVDESLGEMFQMLGVGTR
jgi:MerR family transcriptional regulator/heat shock protein HspR